MTQRPRLLALLLPFLLSGCRLAHTSTGELAELFAMGHERVLRDTLRPARGTERVLIFALDGVNRDVLYGMIRDGRMPITAAVLGSPRGDGLYAHAYAAPDLLSILPSTTIPAWTSVFTGSPPAESGVPGNEWFSREEAKFYAPVPVTITTRTEAARLYTDALLSKLIRVPTLYESLGGLRSYVSASPVFRGADVLSIPNLASFGDLFGSLVGEAISGDVQSSGRVARESDETSTGSLITTMHKHGVADVQTVYFNGIDLLTHHAERPLEDQRRYLQTVTDSLVGKVLDAYREAGALDRTFVIFVSDHGHTPVLPDDRHSLGAEGDDEPVAVLRAAGFRTRPFQLTPDRDDYQAALAWQGFLGYVYLADRSRCPDAGQRCDWSRPPRLEEDVLPVARAFHAASERGEGVPALRGALDLIFVRVPPGPGSGATVRVFDGSDLVPVREYLWRLPRPDLLRLASRVEGLMIGPAGVLAGDIVLLARTGMERPIEERFYFGEPETSDHGSPSEQDSRIPLLVAHPGLSGAAIRTRVRSALGEAPSQLDFVRVVETLLGAGASNSRPAAE
jgi:hypothetical protein